MLSLPLRSALLCAFVLRILSLCVYVQGLCFLFYIASEAPEFSHTLPLCVLDPCAWGECLSISLPSLPPLGDATVGQVADGGPCGYNPKPQPAAQGPTRIHTLPLFTLQLFTTVSTQQI
jgi:hypothetical protein